MKHLLLSVFVLASCNNSSQKASAIVVDTQLDSIIESTDSINHKLMEIDTLATRAYFTTQSEIKQLRKEKRELVQQLESKYPNFKAVQPDDEHLKRINELNKLLIKKEAENAQLRRKIYYDSLYDMSMVIDDKRVRNVTFDRPNENSLEVVFDTKIKNDGHIPVEGLSVYVLPFTKEAKKLMNYDVYCDYNKLSWLNAKEAKYFEGRYFLNDLHPGKYLIKVCYYYGGYEVITKKTGRQLVEMKVSPPTQ